MVVDDSHGSVDRLSRMNLIHDKTMCLHGPLGSRISTIVVVGASRKSHSHEKTLRYKRH